MVQFSKLKNGKCKNSFLTLIDDNINWFFSFGGFLSSLIDNMPSFNVASFTSISC